MLIKIVDEINIEEAYRYLESPVSGGVTMFVGTVRNHSKGKEVTMLSFEAYEPMAIKEMEKIAASAEQRWALDKVVIIHATGEKKPGEKVVVTGASAAHRKAAFEACEYLIDELKKTVPIWKHEWYEDGSCWINAHP